MKTRTQLLGLLKANLETPQNKMKTYVDCNITKRKFHIGERVYLHLQPYHQKTVAMHCNVKLSLCFYGPFQVVQRLGFVAYHLDFPPSSKIHPVFHVSCRKKRLGERIQLLSNLPPTTEGNSCPKAMLDHRLKWQGH